MVVESIDACVGKVEEDSGVAVGPGAGLVVVASVNALDTSEESD